MNCLLLQYSLLKTRISSCGFLKNRFLFQEINRDYSLLVLFI
jgi:hypothetical protein